MKKIEVHKSVHQFKRTLLFELYFLGLILKKTDVDVLSCCNKLLIFRK